MLVAILLAVAAFVLTYRYPLWTTYLGLSLGMIGGGGLMESPFLMLAGFVYAIVGLIIVFTRRN